MQRGHRCRKKKGAVIGITGSRQQQCGWGARGGGRNNKTEGKRNVRANGSAEAPPLTQKHTPAGDPASGTGAVVRDRPAGSVKLKPLAPSEGLLPTFVLREQTSIAVE